MIRQTISTMSAKPIKLLDSNLYITTKHNASSNYKVYTYHIVVKVPFAQLLALLYAVIILCSFTSTEATAAFVILFFCLVD